MTQYGSELYIAEPNNYCSSYKGVSFIGEMDQQNQFWDILGINSLTLAGNSNYIVANKNERNYFFINVIP